MARTSFVVTVRPPTTCRRPSRTCSRKPLEITSSSARIGPNRSLSRDHRRDADRDRRLKLAEEFLTEPSQRAMVHPVPTPKRCFMATASGRVMFDAATDVGPARDVPREAYRRFRADLRARKEQNLKLRAEHLALHEEKTRVIADVGCRARIGGPARSARGRAAPRRRGDRRAD